MLRFAQNDNFIELDVLVVEDVSLHSVNGDCIYNEGDPLDKCFDDTAKGRNDPRVRRREETAPHLGTEKQAAAKHRASAVKRGKEGYDG